MSRKMMQLRTKQGPKLIRYSQVFACMIALFVGSVGCATIPTGMAGIEWTWGQGTLKQPVGEGAHYIPPFAEVHMIDLREQQNQEHLDVLANNGLDIKLETSILYQPISSEIYQLETQLGGQYYRVLISPLLRSSARKIVGRYSPEEIYSTKREQVEHEILLEMERRLQGKHIQVNAVLIREVHLPEIVQEAIQRKLEEEQKALEMKFVLDRERQESERKRIEASGIADYQKIISKGLNNKLLEWKEIEAIRRMANSNNSKTVIIGAGKSGLPLILNAEGKGGGEK